MNHNHNKDHHLLRLEMKNKKREMTVMIAHKYQ